MKKSLLITSIILTSIAIAIYSFAGKQQKTAASNYQRFCAGCHGAALEKFAEKKWMDEDDNASVVRSIKYGIEEEGMPAFQKTFSDTEIAELADYVKKGIPDDRTLLKPAVTPDGIIETESQKYIVETVVSGLKVPWGMVFLSEKEILISEREGTLHRFSDGKLGPPIEGLPEIMASGQGGLLDLALHPDFQSNGWIYIAYSALNTGSKKPTGNTAVIRAKLDGNRLSDVQQIYKGNPDTDRSHHFGTRMAFDGKGHIYISNGDRGQHFEFAQKLDNSNGKIHRLNDDGTIPKDNPFVNTPGAVKSIYSYGHRNPQGLCFHPVTNELWQTEHGPRGGDELNVIKKGANYGWPVISYGINYDGTILTDQKEQEGMEQPLFYWTPSIAPCGMTFITGDRYPEWQNNLLVGALSFKYVERLVIKDKSVIHREKLLEDIGRVRNVVMGPDNLIYVSIENPGKILRLVPVE